MLDSQSNLIAVSYPMNQELYIPFLGLGTFGSGWHRQIWLGESATLACLSRCCVGATAITAGVLDVVDGSFAWFRRRFFLVLVLVAGTADAVDTSVSTDCLSSMLSGDGLFSASLDSLLGEIDLRRLF